jgi:hypothetical protein
LRLRRIRKVEISHHGLVRRSGSCGLGCHWRAPVSVAIYAEWPPCTFLLRCLVIFTRNANKHVPGLVIFGLRIFIAFNLGRLLCQVFVSAYSRVTFRLLAKLKRPTAQNHISRAFLTFLGDRSLSPSRLLQDQVVASTLRRRVGRYFVDEFEL